MSTTPPVFLFPNGSSSTSEGFTSAAVSSSSADYENSEVLQIVSDEIPHLSTVEAVTFAVFMSALIVATVVGNVLVVMSVFTYGPLKTIPNFFVASLACADLTVAVLVMPFSVTNFVIGRWTFGLTWCQAWLTFDILTCTASILHLCAIAIDRYNAIHDPITYALQRTRRRVMIKIAVVWTLSVVISVPPLIGWNGRSLYDGVNEQCQLTDDRGFVVYSAAGSFYIPLAIMTVVYVRIFRATQARLRARAMATSAARLKAAKMSSMAMATTSTFVPSSAPQTHASIRTQLSNQNEPTPLSTPTPPPTGNGNATILLALPLGGSSSGETSDLIPETIVLRETKREVNAETSDVMTSPEVVRPAESIVEEAAAFPRKQQPTLQWQRHLHQQQQQKLVVPRIELDDATEVSLATQTTPSGRKYVGCNSKRCGAPKGGPVNKQLYEFMEEKHRISLSKERRAARTMAIIMGAFVACWLPFFLMYVVFPFCEVCKTSTDIRIVNFIVWLGYVNSALNPVIYTVFNVDLRHLQRHLHGIQRRFPTRLPESSDGQVVSPSVSLTI